MRTWTRDPLLSHKFPKNHFISFLTQSLSKKLNCMGENKKVLALLKIIKREDIKNKNKCQFAEFLRRRSAMETQSTYL